MRPLRSSPISRSPRSIETQICILVFGLALAANLALSAIGWGNTLLGRHEFRQVQTALTTDEFLRHGVRLAYETPLLGPPWEIPLELPVFQACVAGFVHLTAMDLDPAGCLVSWLFFLTALPACFLLLDRFQVPRPHRLLFLALLLLSPLYIFHSRNFLIESTVLSASCWFLWCFGRFLDRPHLKWWCGAAFFGALAGSVKVTTFIVFLVAALFTLGAELRRSGRTSALRLWVRAGFAVLLPIIATLAWIYHTSRVRAFNPEADFLKDHFGYWSFGDLAQRFSWPFWLHTYRVWADSIVGEAGLAFIVVYYCWLRGRYRGAVTACLALFLSGQLIFSNLYWVHDYYFYASGLFLIAAVGFFLAEVLEAPALPKGARWILVAVTLALEASVYHRTYYEIQATSTPLPEVVEMLRRFTRTDDVVVIIGHNWDASIPYYSQRRALMIKQGREFQFDSVRQSVSRLDPKSVGAVVIQGGYWRDKDFVAQAMPGLKLGARPFFFAERFDLAVWVPLTRQGPLRDSFDAARYPFFRIAVEENTGESKTVFAQAIRRRAEFDIFSPRPFRATPFNQFTDSVVDEQKVLNCHAPCELAFRAPAGSRRITAAFGISHNAYTGDGHTDGVEFVISERHGDGTETTLFRRFLNPISVAGDRGLQHLDLTLDHVPTGDLLVRALPGPSGSNSFDWAYWGRIEIR